MSKVEALDPRDPKSVARWAATRVWEDAESKVLWIRVNVDGPGYMLTDVGKEPRAGLWRRIALIDVEDAMRITQRGMRGYPALLRLAEKVDEAFGSPG